jgi:hypothetical protein
VVDKNSGKIFDIINLLRGSLLLHADAIACIIQLAPRGPSHSDINK